MTPLSTAYVATAAICLVVGLQQLVIAFRVPERRIHLLFAAAACAVAGDAANCLRLYWATSASEAMSGLAWGGLFLGAAIVSLVWFVALYTGAVRRWLVLAETAIAVIAVTFGFIVGIAYTEVTELRSIMLPWGETVTMGIGPTSPWRWLGDLVNLGFFAILIDTIITLVRRGEPRKVRVLGGTLVFFSLALLLIIPTDLGLITLPGPHTFAFLLIVAAMSWDLTDELIRGSQLSREVVAGERRWRQLLDSIQLLVVEIDRDGLITFMNPYAERVSGHPAHEMVGRHYIEFVNEKERDEVESSVERGLDGDPSSDVERTLIARSGDRRIIRWRSVALRDFNGKPEGLLSVGADVTERRRSKAELERTAVELEATVRELEVMRTKLEEENIYLKEEIGSRTEHSEILGSSDALLYVLHKIRQVAATDATVLIQGETGVGKELVATAIHNESERSGRPFLAVNCAALPPSLIESELFGHERGSFTGADRRRQGRFELASGGTLFLDEVGELPLEVQPKLLRALQEGTVERIGGSEPIHVDVRLIAATNRDLRQEVETGRFREDLFYRLEVYPITVPPLRDRSDDIEVLVRHFAGELSERHRVEINEIPQEALRLLEAYRWPGNIRELQNVVERAVLNSIDGVLRLVGPLDAHHAHDEPPSRPSGQVFRTLEELQRDHIVEVIEACNGQIAGSGGAAGILGVHPNTLRSRLKKLGIDARK